MQCTLLHKRIAVADITLDDATGTIQKIQKVYAPQHLPVGISVRGGVVDRASLNEWWTDRAIPASRSGVRQALETLNVADTKLLLTRCFGLSLSDQYWIRPERAQIEWDDVNFFDNPFSDDIGDALFGRTKKTDGFDFSSPDNTSDGCLKKRWKIINGKRCLIKGGSNPFVQQPFNEVIASEIMERLNIPHVPYMVIWDGDEPYSVCEDFVTKDTELVSAWRIMQTQKKSNSMSVYGHFVYCCKLLGAPDVVPMLDRMIVLDYIIANEDRHLNNFGLLRNAETLEWLGFAPIFDSGSSLGYDKLASQISVSSGIDCKPFKKHHDEQVKLVSDFGWIDFGKLSDIKDIVKSAFSAERAKERVGEKRIEAIAESVARRVEVLQSIAQSHALIKLTTDDDVDKNIAADYIHKQ
ncbi:HipA domain-containing protein [Pumilibacter intestinalis]|uniref:HipA domain-containing protein n=1 Tax=Pumilibacter intestinalis TaxID=2941511 RepID=UPI00203F66C9|nr:HipA domain-containing protein [Pumilibacter intestinalis]